MASNIASAITTPHFFSALIDRVDRVLHRNTPSSQLQHLEPTPNPDPAVASDAGDFLRVYLLDHIETCHEEDCENDTRLAVESRDAAPVPCCQAHAHVLFADWMVGA